MLQDEGHEMEGGVAPLGLQAGLESNRSRIKSTPGRHTTGRAALDEVKHLLKSLSCGEERSGTPCASLFNIAGVL